MAVMQKMNIATGESNEISLLDAKRRRSERTH